MSSADLTAQTTDAGHIPLIRVAGLSQLELDIHAIRAFLHGTGQPCSMPDIFMIRCTNGSSYLGGEDAWEVHERVEGVLSQDPTLDKSQRSVTVWFSD